jgi:hypothetical protein
MRDKIALVQNWECSECKARRLTEDLNLKRPPALHQLPAVSWPNKLDRESSLGRLNDNLTCWFQILANI